MVLGKSEAWVLSRLFSAAVFRDFSNQASSSLFTRLINHTRFVDSGSLNMTVEEVYEDSFRLLGRSQFRDDYVYRGAIVNKILLGRYSLRTTTLLNEVRAGSCKADVVILNRTSMAYEIKSERDSLVRLRNQINNYRKVFATVNVVVSEKHVSKVIKTVPEDVGIVTLSQRFHFQTERKAQDRPDRIDPAVVLGTLRIGEAIAVATRLGQEVNVVPNTQVRSELTTIFAKLDPTNVHTEMVEVLKRTRSQKTLADPIKEIPASMRAASLIVRPTLQESNRIKEAARTELERALSWK